VCIWPDHYANGAASMPDLDALPPAFQDFALEMRQTPAGRFVMASYAEHRVGPRG
jgi:hypothetical protein